MFILQSNSTRTKVSNDAPEWFHVINEEKAKQFDTEQRNKLDTLLVFSRYNQWVTVTPRSKNRRMPLEKIKSKKTEETSKIMPKWMQIVPKNTETEKKFYSKEYNSIRDVFLN
jgi:hypothetical protein